jgi:hypothetical protein
MDVLERVINTTTTATTTFSISAIVSKDFSTLPQFLQANVGIIPQIRP